MKLYAIIAVLISSLLVSGTNFMYAQTNERPELLKVGDKVPDITFTKLMNYHKDQFSVARYKEKELLILVYWSVTCIPCVAKFPSLDSLQRKFDDKLQIMLVTPEDGSFTQNEKYLRRFFHRVRQNKNLILPSAIDPDGELKKYFTKDNLVAGDHIWIQEGNIIALTYSEGMTEKNILNALVNHPIEHNRMQAKSLLPFDFSKSLISNKFNDTPVKYHSTFMGQIPQLEPNPHVKEATEDDKTCGIRLINSALLNMYLRAYNVPLGYRLLIEADDNNTTNQLPPNSPLSQPYCYELIAQGKSKAELLAILREDLKKVFGYSVTKEKRKVDCIILKRSGKIPETHGGEPSYESSIFHLSFTNMPASELIRQMKRNLPGSDYPFLIDKTRVGNMHMDVDINADMNDLLAMREELKKYNIDLKIRPRKMEMFILKND